MSGRPRTLGDLLTTLRHSRGFSQVELSGRLGHIRGMSQSASSRIENDDYFPDAGQLEAILRALETTQRDMTHARELAIAAVVIGHRLEAAP